VTKNQAGWALLMLFIVVLYVTGIGQRLDRLMSPFICEAIPIWPGCR
jgi:hypothetical protein